MDTERLKSAWETVMANPDRYLYVVADEDGKISASCNVAIIPNLTRSARPYAVIENVITHPDARRKGLGRKVMEKAMAFAGMHNCYKVMLLSGSHLWKPMRSMKAWALAAARRRGLSSSIWTRSISAQGSAMNSVHIGSRSLTDDAIMMARRYGLSSQKSYGKIG
jgi:GNAT superfamily N-acetyltransferase